MWGLRNIQNYYSGVKPVMVDGLLYVLIALFGAMEALLNEDDSYKYNNPYFLYWSKFVIICLLSIVSALKMFRSTSYSDHLATKQAVESNQQIKTEQTTKQVITQESPVTTNENKPNSILPTLGG